METRRLAWFLAATFAPAVMAAAAQLDPDRLAGFRARSIGPAGMSGRVSAIEGVASAPHTAYVGTATGGVWKTTNGGLTFTPIFDDQPVHAIGAVGVFQPNPDIVWVGTGEGNPRNSVSVGNGVYKSMDGGKTWKHLGLEKTERIHRLLTHPTDPDTAYACAIGQLWGENPERGVFKTADGGRTWQHVLRVDEKTGCGDLVIDPQNPQKLIAGMWQVRRWPYFFKSGGPGSGLYLTFDAGASWRKLQEEDGLPKGDLGRSGLAISYSHPEIVYAIVEAKQSALLRSEDGGTSWTTVNQRPDVAPRPFYYADLRVDPEWPNRVYSLDYEVRVSNDGGKTFQTLPGASWAQIHGDHHALWIAPHDPTFIYNGNDGGVAVSHDRGRTFRFAGNLTLAQFYHVGYDMDRPYHVYGGLQDNGSWRGPSSVWQDGGIRNHHWQTVGGGDGFDTQPDPRDSSQGYSMWQGGYLGRWNLETGEQRPIKPASPESVKLRFNWNAGFAIDPFQPDTIYLGSQFLHRSKDRGETWETVSPDLTTNRPEWQKADQSGGITTDATSAENYETIVSVAPSPLEKGLIWVGTDDGRLHLTRDGGSSWVSLEANLKGVPANTWIPHIDPSPTHPAAALVVLDNHRRSDLTPYVYGTEDYGKTWKSLVTPEIRGYCLVARQDPVNKNLLYLGTEFGLYVSWNGGGSWVHMKKTIPTASVMDLAIHPREHDLILATHGRGIWILDDLHPLRELSEAILQKPLELLPVAEAQQFSEQPEDGGFGFGAGEFRGESRPYGAILTYAMNLPGLPLQDEEKERARKEQERAQQRAEAEAAPSEPGEAAAAEKRDEAKKDDKGDQPPKVTIEVRDASGTLIRTFKAPARQGINRAAWNLRRDAFKQLPRAEDAPPLEEEPSGHEVPPGSYSVTVKYDGHQASQPVVLAADPRSRNTPADWQRRWASILDGQALLDRLVEAVWRIRRTRDDIALVQKKVRQQAEDKGEKDEDRLAELPLVKSGGEVVKGLTDLEKKLWSPPEVAGILPSNDVLSDLWYPVSCVLASWDPPSPTHLAHLERGRSRLEALLKELNAFFDKQVDGYRQQVAQAEVRLLPELVPLTLAAPAGEDPRR